MEIIQQRYHQKLFAVLIPALEDPEPRWVPIFFISRLYFVIDFSLEYMLTPLPLFSTFAKE
jgi:hypothetical protein